MAGFDVKAVINDIHILMTIVGNYINYKKRHNHNTSP